MTAFPLGVVSNARVWTGSPDASISFIGSNSNSDNKTAYTFTNQSIGSADTDRIVAVFVYAPAVSGDFASVTIGGNAATKAISVFDGVNIAIGIYYLAVPTGTTATITVTCSDEAARCAIGVYRIIKGHSSDPVFTASVDGGGSIDLTEVTGGATVYGALRSTNTAYTVSRDTVSLTPDVSSTFGGNALVKIGDYALSGSPNATDTGTYAVDFNDGKIIAAHWR